MLEPSPRVISDESLPESSTEFKPRDSFIRPILGVLFSAVIPGAGHWVLNKKIPACALSGLFLIFLLCFWPLRILRFYWGFVAVCFLGISLYLYSGVSACLNAVRTGRRAKLWVIPVTALSFLGLILVFKFTTRTAGFRVFGVPSTSMEKTIYAGDDIMVDTHYFSDKALQRKQIVVFQHENLIYVKRAIGIGGDLVQGSSGKVLVNGEVMEEPYVVHSGSPPFWMQTFGPVFVLSHQYFVMGDNRDVSRDSRSRDFGLVPAEELIGTPLYVLRSRRQGLPIR